MIKVVDIFAGPGGLSEGFASVLREDESPAFDISLSIEKDPSAHQTLLLRSFFRAFENRVPEDYYSFLRKEEGLPVLYERHPIQANRARQRCWLAELGTAHAPIDAVRDRVTAAVKSTEDWVLIGGPPCQAYSIVGRSRNRGNSSYDPSTDVRQRLYVEYLQVLADHQPAVFIMENVKGLLSAELKSERLFHRILEDLRSPGLALAREGRRTLSVSPRRYRIYSLVTPKMFEDGDIRGSVVKSEHYGVPQARHRVILIGLREDLDDTRPQTMKPQDKVTAGQVLHSLPPLRSGLSREVDSAFAWEQALRSQAHAHWVEESGHNSGCEGLPTQIREYLKGMSAPLFDRGGEYVPLAPSIGFQAGWFLDDRINGTCNHRSRSHMQSDLCRYIFAASFACSIGRSPTLRDFPPSLLPHHLNAHSEMLRQAYFSDRFRVQMAVHPSTTVVSHISKDGHYYIHYDPGQCRSLTVREAARLQTFPDNYFFCGSMTAQYTQVGNAVPPLLAKQIGEIVYRVIAKAGGG